MGDHAGTILIHPDNTDELKQRLIQFRYNLDQISINTAIDHAVV